MSLNTDFDEIMEAGVNAFVQGADVNEASAHATFQMTDEQLPEGITAGSLQTHVNFINNTSAQLEMATAQLGRQAYENNNDITNFDGSLEFGGVTFQSQHIIKQDLGENTLYGQSTTTTDYQYSDDLNNWQDQMRNANMEAAAKFFN